MNGDNKPSLGIYVNEDFALVTGKETETQDEIKVGRIFMPTYLRLFDEHGNSQSLAIDIMTRNF